jgi:hypothetical protein
MQAFAWQCQVGMHGMHAGFQDPCKSVLLHQPTYLENLALPRLLWKVPQYLSPCRLVTIFQHAGW